MNYTLNKLTYEIIDLYRDFIKDTDSLDVRIVQQWIHNVRAMLLKQKIQKSIYTLDKTFVQEFKSDLEFVDVSLVSGITIGDNILLTDIDIPRAIEDSSGLEYFTNISTVDRTERPFKFIPLDMLPYAGSSRFDYHTIYVFRIGDKLGIYSKDDRYKSLGSIGVNGIFQNPIEAGLLSDTAYSADDRYPVTISMVNEIKNIILKDYFKISVDKPDDKTTDEEHNLTRE